MGKVAVVYHSGTGHTAKMAEAVAKGAGEVSGVTSKIFAIKPEQIIDGRWKDEAMMKELDEYDAIIFGSPTYMGSYSGQFKCFADATGEKYMDRKWQDKFAGGFTVSGGPSGDKLNTLISMAVLSMQLGMIWVGQNVTPFNDKGINRLSSYFGPMGQAMTEPVDQAPNSVDKLTGEIYGKRVAELVKKFKK